MNESGGPVKALASHFNVPVERTLIVHDDAVALPACIENLAPGVAIGLQSPAPSLSKRLDSHDTDVVARWRVLGAGIAEPHDQPGRHGVDSLLAA